MLCAAPFLLLPLLHEGGEGCVCVWGALSIECQTETNAPVYLEISAPISCLERVYMQIHSPADILQLLRTPPIHTTHTLEYHSCNINGVFH